jgi:hypothetical protein
VRRQPWKQAPLKAELLRLLAEDADFRAAVREAMQIPATAKALTAEEPAATPVSAAAVRGGGDLGYLSVRARSPSLSPLPREPSTASPSA